VSSIAIRSSFSTRGRRLSLASMYRFRISGRRPCTRDRVFYRAYSRRSLVYDSYKVGRSRRLNPASTPTKVLCASLTVLTAQSRIAPSPTTYLPGSSTSFGQIPRACARSVKIGRSHSRGRLGWRCSGVRYAQSAADVNEIEFELKVVFECFNDIHHPRHHLCKGAKLKYL